MKLTIDMSYRKKRQMLLLLVIGIICFTFYRGYELQEVKSITDRVRFHAIPVAMSVLYHNSPHDYTGLHAIAMPFQGPGEVGQLINIAKRQSITNDKATYYWVADDRGYADYVIAAFYLFGAKIDSLYYMWFLVLVMSTSLFVISFNRKIWALGFLSLILLGVNLAISTLPLATFNRGYSHYIGGISIHEPRFLDVLAIIAVFHLVCAAFSVKSFKLIRDGFPVTAQLLILICLFHARSSLGWEILAVFACCIVLFSTRLYRCFQNNSSYKSLHLRKGLFSPIIIAASLLISLIGLSVYKHQVYNAEYYSEMGVRTFWHNALMGLVTDPYLWAKYNVAVDDAVIVKTVINYASQSKRCTSDIAMLDPQQILNSLGGHGVVNWVNYENCAKLYFFDILSQNKLKMLRLYFVLKPLQSFSTVISYIKDYNIAQLDAIRSELSIGWRPLSVVNGIFLLLIYLLSHHSLVRIQKNILIVTTITLVFSTIPSVFFYSGVLTLGGLLVVLGVLFYLYSIILAQKLIKFIRKPKNMISNQINSLSSKKLTIVIPAYNEEKRIETTINEVYHAAKNVLDDFEIIVIDDGSVDATYLAAMSAVNKLGHKAYVIRQDYNQGVGAAFYLGLSQAKFSQLCLIPGDNAYHITGVELLFSKCGTTPLVISFRQNMEARTPLRHFLSRMATMSLRIITGFKVRDAHSLYLFPVEETRQLGMKSAGYGYHIEILSRLLNRLQSFSEVPVILNPKPDASSGVMKPGTLIILFMTISKLFGLRLIGKL